MSEAFRNIRFKCNFHGERIEGTAINPGDWFGKVWLVQVNVANAFQPVFAVEADTEADAIDVLADDEQYGHWINIDEKDVVNEEEVDRAGNDGHPVDLDNVRVYPKPLGLTYFVQWSPEFYDKSSSIDEVVKEYADA